MGEPGEDTQPISRHESWLPDDHPLYRPRHGKQQFALVCAIIFFAAPLVSLAMLGRPPAIENRPLHEFPSVSQGWGFFTGLNAWATDWLPLRSAAINLNDSISRGVFGEPPQAGSSDSQPITPPAGNQGGQPGGGQVNGVYPTVLEGKGGWLYFGDDAYAKCNPTTPLSDTVKALAAFKQVVQQSGRQFVLVIPPDKSDIFPDYLPDQYPGKDCAPVAATEFWKQMGSNVGYLDLKPALYDASVKLGRPIYFRTDSHWLFNGGLTMATRLADQISPGVTAGWRSEPGRTVTITTDLPPLLNHKGTEQTPMPTLAPDGGANRAQNYLGHSTLSPIEVHTTPVKGMVTTSVGMISDSFTEYADPYLTAGFSDITVMHTDYVQRQLDQAAQHLVDSKVVVIEAAERLLAGGTSPILSPGVLATLGQQLAAHPMR